MIWIILLVVALISYFGARWMIETAESRGLLDKPNERSSHSIPTPRGGGAAIVFAFLIAMLTCSLIGFIPAELAFWVTIPSILVAGIGFIDDHGHISAKVRLAIHSLAMCIVVYGLTLPEFESSDSLFVYILLAFCVWVGGVWLINLFNFMDGIDGIASMQILSVVALQCLLVLSSDIGIQSHSFLILSGITLASVLGFLILNFPPAKIFMGDVGSGFLGLIGAVLLVMLLHFDFVYFVAGCILWAAFIVDSTYTLLRRLFTGQNIFQAHRLHAYQKLATKWQSHRKVTLVFTAVNVFYLFPLALLVVHDYMHYYLGLMVAYIPLVGHARSVKAGIQPEKEK